MKNQKENPYQMKPNELRVGNIISLSNGTHHTVSKFDDCKVWFEKVTNQHGVKCWIVSNIENVAPIPLTEELLLKCGFDDKDYKQGYIGKDHKAGCMTMDFVLSKPLRMGAWQDYYAYDLQDHRFKSIEYLHQLQNLHFALTGEELEINL